MKVELSNQKNSRGSCAALAGGNILAKLDRQLHGLGDVDAELVKVVD